MRRSLGQVPLVASVLMGAVWIALVLRGIRQHRTEDRIEQPWIRRTSQIRGR